MLCVRILVVFPMLKLITVPLSSLVETYGYFLLHSFLLPLNVCRKQTYYMPWECDHERHTYEK